MPNFRSGNFKQKNKKFKGKNNKQKNKFKTGTQNVERVKKINKNTNKKVIDCPTRIKRKNHKQNLQNQQTDALQEKQTIIENSTILSNEQKQQLSDNIKSLQPVKIVLVFSLNEFEQNLFINEINKYTLDLKQKQPINSSSQVQHVFQQRVWNTNQFPQLKNKEKFILISCPRNSETFLDFCKISDVCISITTVKHVNQTLLNKDPKNNLNAIDEIGEQFINLFNAQGTMNMLNVVTDIHTIQQKKQKDVKFYFKRLLNESFPNGKVCFVENETEFMKFLVNLMNLKSTAQNWRSQRGYFLTDLVEILSNGNIILSGYAKNQFCVEELVHLTGFGDLQPQSFQTEFESQRQNVVQQFQVQSQHSMLMFGESKNENFEQENENDELANLNQHFNDMNILNDQEEILEQSDQEDISFNTENVIAEESQSRNQMRLQQRQEDELYFQDEVEYESNIKVREQYQDFKYMKSFLKNTWNIYDSLPKYYQNLFNFPNIKNTHNIALKNRKQFCFDGQYLRIQFQPSQELANFLSQNVFQAPLIISSLLNHERKVGQNHFQLRFHNENEQEMFSEQVYYVHQGFRKFQTAMTFANIYSKCTKFKHVNKIKPHYTNWYLGSFYNQIYYPNQNVLIFEQNQEKLGKLLMIGNTLYPDNFKVILKRIILTGYPLKAKKKTAVIKYMFFNPEDVDFYKQNEIYTKNGLKGKIKESLGTKGLMKCHFNGFVKQNDVVCMNLYKRVFPAFNYLIN